MSTHARVVPVFFVAILFRTPGAGAEPEHGQPSVVGSAPTPRDAAMPNAAGSDSTARPPGGEGDAARSSPSDAEALHDLESLYDPTILARFFAIEAEYKDGEHDAWSQEVTLVGSYAWSVMADVDLGIRAGLPLAYVDPGRSSGADEEFGLSDFKVTPAVAFRSLPELGQGFGLETVFDTSTEEGLGADSFIVKPIYGAGLRLLEYVTLTGVVGYKASLWEEKGAERTRILDVSPAVNFTSPKVWRAFAGITYKGARDFEAEEYTNRMSVTLGKELGTSRLFSLVVGCEFPLDSQSREVSVGVGFSYFFE